MYDWGLQLPEASISRRIAKSFNFSGADPQVLAEIAGSGCVRRFWITGKNIGRHVTLRIFADQEPTPYVEAPLADFFGVMHNLSERDEPYRVNTPFLAVKPHNGFTCYFPMPFSDGLRVEVEGSPDVETRLYYMLDWHEYPQQRLDERKRFCCRWRREAPVKDYADEFIMLDADGPGRLAGFVYSVDMLESRQTMRWSHAGADNIYLDGMGCHPAFLRGIGGEDTFGVSYGGAEYPAQTSFFSDLPYYVQKDAEGDRQKLVGYRFFAQEAVRFDESVHMRFAARAHDIAATVYWYAEGAVRPFYRLPPLEQRWPGSVVRRGEYDEPAPDSGQWQVFGPFETSEQPDALPPVNPETSQVYAAVRGFVDFNHLYRPDPTNRNSPTLAATAAAQTWLAMEESGPVRFVLGWDDSLWIQVNDGPVTPLGRHAVFGSAVMDVDLQAGENRIRLWLDNEEGLSRGAWLFSFSARRADGRLLRPGLPG